MRLALALGLLEPLLALGCAASDTFACSDDEQCQLAGTPGVCTEIGQCAYPNTDCTSGWAYPPGAPGLGGDCAEGPGDATATATDEGSSSAGSETSVGTSVSSSATSGTTSPATATATTSAGTDDSAGGSTGGMSSVGTGGGTCPPDESNAVDNAVPLAPDNGCSASLEGTFHGVDDEDWFSIDYTLTCTEAEFVSVEPGDIEATVCIKIDCGPDPVVSCSNSSEILEAGLQGCCSSPPHPADFSLDVPFGAPCGDISIAYIQVLGSSMSACDPYMMFVDSGD